MELTRRIAAGALAVAVAAVAFFVFAGVAKADYIGVQVGQEKKLEAPVAYLPTFDSNLQMESSNPEAVRVWLDTPSKLFNYFMVTGNKVGSSNVSLSFDTTAGPSPVTYSCTVKVSEKKINDGVELKLGESRELSAHQACEPKDGALPKVTSSNSKVASISYKQNYKGRCYFTVKAVGFGTTTCTMAWTNSKGEEVTYATDVIVKDASISAAQCSGLKKGKTYTAKTLVKKAGISLPSGKFVKGSGYSVLSNGYKVKLAKKGAVTVKYKVGKTTHSIKLEKVS